ncbi:hypothetical protein [Nocardia sp. NPDC056564]|uniref:hypothetical protein n=2 Tax=unclassified Nocardia TaxID=2637762 RepID=UPI00366ED7C5
MSPRIGSRSMVGKRSRRRGFPTAAALTAALLAAVMTTVFDTTATAQPDIPCAQWQQMHPGWPCIPVPKPPPGPAPGPPATTPALPTPVLPGAAPGDTGDMGGHAGALTPPALAPGNGTPIVPVPGEQQPAAPGGARPPQPPSRESAPDPSRTAPDQTTVPDFGTPAPLPPTAAPPPVSPGASAPSIRDQLPVQPVSRCGEEREWSFSQGCHNKYDYKVVVHQTNPNYTPPGTTPYDTCSAASDGISCTVSRSTTISRTVTKTGQLGVDATIGALKASGQVSQSVADTESLTIGETGGKAPSVPMKAGETMSAYPTYTQVLYEVQRYDAGTGQYVSTEQKQALFPEGSTYLVGPTGAPNGFPAPPPGIVPAPPQPSVPHQAGGN